MKHNGYMIGISMNNVLRIYWVIILRDYLEFLLDASGASWGNLGASKGGPGGLLGASCEHFEGFGNVYEAIRCNMQKPSNLLQSIAKIEVGCD